MDTKLLFQRMACEISTEPVRHVFASQMLAKILSPGEFELGLRAHDLSRYRYASGEMTMCRRNTEEWVRWRSPMQVLLVAVPDDTMLSVAEEMGVGSQELQETSRLEDDRVKALVAAAEAEHAAGSPAGRVYTDGLGRALAAALLQSRGTLQRPMRTYRGGLTPVQLRRVTGFVHAHLHQDLSLMQMAEEAGLSPSYFSQMFRQSTGLAPHQFVLRARVERAKELLAQPRARVLDVALACGFQTQQHFARVFRMVCRTTPTEFRRGRLV